MSGAHELRQILRRDSTPQLVRLTLREELRWDTMLADPAAEPVVITGYGALVDEVHRGVPPEKSWSGRVLLSSWAPTPFELHGERFESIESFYHAIKYPSGSERRREIAAMSGDVAQHRAQHKRGDSFTWQGCAVEVGSVEHAEVIAEAIVAKLDQNEAVRVALKETGHAPIEFPYGVRGRNAIAQATPWALMIERARRRISPS
jgi:hypothetical protein